MNSNCIVKKTIGKIWLLMVFVLISILLFSITAFAAQEYEDNNNVDNATAIDINTYVNGSLSSSKDTDWYKFSIPSDGYFDIRFEHDYIDSSSRYWKIYIFDSTGTAYVDGNSDFFGAYGRETRVTSSFGVKAGTYYVKITDDYYSGVNYKLKVEYTAASDWETEINNSKDSADSIQVNQTYNGSLSTNGDVDWYRIDISTTCEVALVFKHDLVDSGSKYWCIDIFDSGASKSLFFRGVSGREATVTTDYITLTSGVYYLRIKDDYYSNKNYSFCLKEKHDCNGTFKTIIAPTCMEVGEQKKQCDVCGDILDTKSIPATGHTCNNWIIDQDATCTKTGKRHAVCAVCGESVYEDITMIPHAYGSWEVAKEPTCHNGGSQTKTCTKCGKAETEALAQLTHQFGEWQITKDATCDYAGVEECTCLLCGDRENKTIAQLVHEYGSWEIISGSKLIPPIIKEKRCVYCGDAEMVEDWSNVWITILAAVVAIGLVIGLVNYVRAFKKEESKGIKK